MPLLPADTAAPAPAPTEGLTDAGPKKAKKGRPYNNRKKTAERSADLHQGIKAIKDASKAQAVKLANDLAISPSQVLPLLSDAFAKKPRAVNSWNARMRAAAESAKASGQPFTGRNALVELARSEAMKHGARPPDNSDDEDEETNEAREEAAKVKEEQVRALEKYREENAKPKKWVKDSQINADVTHVFQKCVKELNALFDRSEAEWSLMIAKKGIESTYPTMTGGSRGMRQAALVVTRGTLDKLALQMEAFIVSGAEGPIQVGSKDGGKNAEKHAIVTLIRDLFLVEWLRKNPGKTADDAPRMAYKNYPVFRADTGLEIVGYPEQFVGANGDLVHPSSFKTVAPIRAMHYALRHGEIRWRELDQEEWDLAQEEQRKVVVTEAGESSKKRKATSAAKAPKPKKKKTTTSAETVVNSDDVQDGANGEVDGQDGTQGEV